MASLGQLWRHPDLKSLSAPGPQGYSKLDDDISRLGGYCFFSSTPELEPAAGWGAQVLGAAHVGTGANRDSGRKLR
ncbi:hypothetical protein ACN38_g7780 [Penicillium nordicum]|uniref:Uncharacterized protein n=1 Tax=Penicillium nordicum TaxID=229535 RepID=A0A0M9WE41_9EURO|nr:hypothetical protein ACN38_g7780 [Penicillium nordicum]